MGIETALIAGGIGLAGNIISGNKQAKAAKQAAATQADAAMYAADRQAESEAAQLAAQQQALAKQQALMSPYNEFGQSFMGQTQQAAEGLGQLYSNPTSIMKNPMFQAIQNQAQTDIMQNAAVSGRLGTGGSQVALQDSALRTGFDVLNQERAAQSNYLSMMQGLVAGGQNAAAGMGAGQLQSGANMANTMQNSILNQNNLTVGAANAQAAGIMGAANAQSDMISGITGGLGTMLGGFGPTIGGNVAGTNSTAMMGPLFGGGR